MQHGNKSIMRRILITAAVGMGAVSAIGLAAADEHPAGDPVQINGMEVAGVFLQPVKMDPAMSGQDAAKTDIHLEADIAALPGNENGFEAGAWMPYLSVDYTLAKKDSDWKSNGKFMPMVASDGPHYGANVKLDGPGEYQVTFKISPPSQNGFMRHFDKETGVAEWWAPFTYEGSFIFAGTGKKGGY